MRSKAVKMLRDSVKGARLTGSQWRGMKRNYARLPHTEKAQWREAYKLRKGRL